MAMVNCRECKNAVSDQAESCPHCGIKNPAPIAAPTPAAPEPGGSSTLMNVIIFFSAIFAFSMVVSQCDRGPSSAELARRAEVAEAEKIAKMSEKDRAAYMKAKADQVAKDEELKAMRGAGYACKEFVLRSAHDPDGSDLDSPRDYPVTKTKKGNFAVRVTGRMKNGFGALRRTNIVCTVRLAGDNFMLVDMKENN